MITFLAGIVGPKTAKPVLIGLILLVLFGGGFALAKCTGGNDAAEAQAEQTTRSGEAIANAAEAAVETIGNRAVTEREIDQATMNVMEQIENAQDPAIIRDAVRNSVCGKPSHRNDPACAVR